MSEDLLQIAHRIKAMTNYYISTQQTEYVLRCMIAILRFEQNQQFSRQLKAQSQMQDGVNSVEKKSQRFVLGYYMGLRCIQFLKRENS